MTRDHVVLDVEIQRIVNGPPDNMTWQDTDKLGVACAVLYEFKTDRFRVYGPRDVAALRERLMSAERISGYNIWKFDLPVIWSLPGRQSVPQLASRCDDLLRRIWIALKLNPDDFGDNHKGWGLDNVARATLQAGKTGYGGDAPKWFQDGHWSRVVDYCINDVALERDLCAFVDKNGYVKNDAVGAGTVLRIPEWVYP